MEVIMRRKHLKSKVIDLFCGIGGLSYGFKQEGFDVVAGYDIDETCKYAYEENVGGAFEAKDIRLVTKADIDEKFGDAEIRILVGCAPCQPFSSYTFKQKEKDNNKWGLLYEFSRLIKETKPDIVSMENVRELMTFKEAPVLADFVVELESMGYNVNYKVVNCSDYGVPQSRKRLVLLASLLGKITLIDATNTPEHYVTVRDVIGDLPSIQAGEKHPEDVLHCARALSPLNLERIQHTPAGGGWSSWPEHLRLACHKKESGKSYGSVYGRIVWDAVAPTITTQCTSYGSGRFGHPEQNRAISVREAALLQTFPADYKLNDPDGELYYTILARQIGNAVPVRLGQVIAQSIKAHLGARTIAES